MRVETSTVVAHWMSNELMWYFLLFKGFQVSEEVNSVTGLWAFYALKQDVLNIWNWFIWLSSYIYGICDRFLVENVLQKANGTWLKRYYRKQLDVTKTAMFPTIRPNELPQSKGNMFVMVKLLMMLQMTTMFLKHTSYTCPCQVSAYLLFIWIKNLEAGTTPSWLT